MADITMCVGENCSIKKTCYRHTAIENEFRQSWFVKEPYTENKCEYFIPIQEVKS